MFSSFGRATFFVKNNNNIMKYSYNENINNMNICSNSKIFFRFDNDETCEGINLNPFNIHLEMLHFEEYVVTNLSKFPFLNALLKYGFYVDNFEKHFIDLKNRYGCFKQMESCFISVSATENFIKDLSTKEIEYQRKKGYKIPDTVNFVIGRDLILAVKDVFEFYFNNIQNASYNEIINLQKKYNNNVVLFNNVIFHNNFEVYRYSQFLRLCYFYFCKNIKKILVYSTNNIILTF